MRLLFVWDYDRTDISSVIFNLVQQAELFFIYKYNDVPEDRKHNLNIFYWNNFKSPYEVLRRIKPDKIIFISIESFQQVALNIAAKNSGIKTYRMEHGLKAPFSSYLSHELSRRKGNPNPGLVLPPTTPGHQLNTILFYLRSFRLKNIFSLYWFIKFIYVRKKLGLNLGLKNCRFKLRNADVYIDFTHFNSRCTRERDNPSPDQFRFVGNPVFDKYFQSGVIQHERKSKPYYLLIDSGFVEDNITKMKPEVLINFYMKLNEYCKSKQAGLRIKLHPLSYNAQYLPEDENIVFLRQVDLLEEISNCEGCFHSHFSTLTPLALYYKKGVLFDAYAAFNVDLINLKLVPVLDFYSFEPADIKFNEHSDRNRGILIENYLYATDGKAGERLAKILTD